MSTNLEIEVKSKLTKEDYEKLLARFSNAKIYCQNNYYIDNKSLQICKSDCGLRIREKDSKFELPLKVPAKEGKIEINRQISNILFEKLAKSHLFPNGEVKDYLETKLGIKTNELSILGELKTERLDIAYLGALISIDKSYYNNVIDYEIEIEDKSLIEASKHLQQFLLENSIEYKKSPDTKLKRFIDTL